MKSSERVSYSTVADKQLNMNVPNMTNQQTIGINIMSQRKSGQIANCGMYQHAKGTLATKLTLPVAPLCFSHSIPYPKSL